MDKIEKKAEHTVRKQERLGFKLPTEQTRTEVVKTK